MIKGKLAFISFEPNAERFRAFLSIEGFILSNKDPELTIRKAVKIYENSIIKMRTFIKDIHSIRDNHQLLPARKVWQLGNAIFGLQGKLNKLSLQLDGFYDHLVRDLGVKRKWLEKVITFRRYLPDEKAIPQLLNWGRCCEKGTRRAAEKLSRGLPLG